MGPAGNDAEDCGRSVESGSIFLNHHFCGFYDRGYGIALFELQFVGTAARDCTFNKMFADANHNVGHDIP